MKTYRITIAALLLSFGTTSFAVVNESAIIKGFAEWQAGRIEKIVLETGLARIDDNARIRAFFPSTASQVLYELDSNGRSLANVVKDSMDKDLDRMNYIIARCVPTIMNTELSSLENGVTTAKLSKAAGEFNLLFDGFEALIAGGKTVVVKREDEEQKEVTIGSTADFDEHLCGTAGGHKSEWEKVAFKKVELDDYLTQLRSWIVAGNWVEDDKFVDFAREEGFAELVAYAATIASLVEKSRSIEKQKENTFMEVTEIKESGYAERVRQLTNMLDLYLDFGDTDYPAFRKMKRTALFLADLADASKTEDGPTSVAAVLSSYVDDQATYLSKREPSGYFNWYSRFKKDKEEELGGEWVSYKGSCAIWGFLPCRNTLFISSYWGVAYSHDQGDGPISDERNGWRPFGPVGLEWKLLTYESTPISINYAPIDIGNYIKHELMDTAYDDAKFSDINSPSVFLSWSLKRYPVAFLMGHQWNMKSDRGEEDSAFLALTFDLPVFTIF